jgi:hypothetical protein
MINLETLDDKHYAEKTARRVAELRSEASAIEQQARDRIAARLKKESG